MKASVSIRLDADRTLHWNADWSGASDADCKRIIARLLSIRRDILRTMKSGSAVREVTGTERRA